MPALAIEHQVWPLRASFRISRGAKTEAQVIAVSLTDAGHRGQGEAVPYPRYGESSASVSAQIEAARAAIEAGSDRQALLDLMPPGAARNALDCALWDLEAKRAGKRPWQMAGLAPPDGLITAYTLSLDSPENMARAAAQAADRELLKLKLTGAGDIERVQAVREAAPEVRLIVDANEAWAPDMVLPHSRALAKLGVELIEQPLPADADGALAEIDHPVPICADESCHVAADVARLKDRYDVVNIKLDKAGGLTAALALAAAAEQADLAIMVGCMVGTSLSMAPAMVVAQRAAFVDLDGPLLLARDREPPITYEGSKMQLPPKA